MIKTNPDLPAAQELQPYGIFELKTVLFAPMLKNCHENDLKAALRQIFLLVGLRPQNIPKEEEKAYLLGYIYETYGHKTLAEIVLAFKLAIKGELDIDRNDVKVYDQFTPAYFSVIMEGYRIWLKKKNSMVPPAPVNLLEQRKKLTDEEWEEWLKDMKDYPFENIPLIAYERINPKLTAGDKMDYFKAAVHYKLTKLPLVSKERSEFEAWIKNQPKGDIYDSVADLAKKMIVKDLLGKM